MVVQEYNSNLGSAEEMTHKYKIKSRSTVLEWISNYNRQEELEDYASAWEVYKMKARKTTKEERIEIVIWCVINQNNYKKTASRFNCSYIQVYIWIKKYKSDGEEGLVIVEAFVNQKRS